MRPPLKHEIALIGAPSDAGAAQPGTRLGPLALRTAGLQAAIEARGWQIRDTGDLHGPPPSGQPAREGYRHLDEVAAWARQVRDAVDLALTHGHLPILLGGDHSLSIGSLSAVARHLLGTGRKLRVLWLDAHADCNSRRTSPSANLHGMAVACVCGLGPSELTALAGQTPAVAPASFRLVGVRSIDPGEDMLVRQLDLRVLDMAMLRSGGLGALRALALDGLDADTHLHVSLDIDVLDPGTAPGTATAVPGGARLEEALAWMRLIGSTGRVGSVDLMELDPTLDSSGQSGNVAVALLAALFDTPPSAAGPAESAP